MSNSDLAKRYIGKQISLISTSHVRYEGYLYTIDESAQTVALQNVVCMGTEGRRHGDQAIGPSDTTYEFIIFRGMNIQHFYVKDDERNYAKGTKPTVDKTHELFAALGIEDDAHYGGKHSYMMNSNTRGHKERPSSRLVLADEPRRVVGRGDLSPRDDYGAGYPPQRSGYGYNNSYRDQQWSQYPVTYPRGGNGGPYPNQPPRGRRDRGRPRYDDRYESRAPPPDRRRGNGQDMRQRGDDRRRNYRGNTGNKNQNGNINDNNRSRKRRNQRGGGGGGGSGGGPPNNSRRQSNRRTNTQTSRTSGGGRRKQAGTGEFLTKAGRGEELEINVGQLFDFEEAKTKFVRTGDAEAKNADDDAENKASVEVTEDDSPVDQKINDSTESSEIPQTDDAEHLNLSNVKAYDANLSFFDALSTDNAQRTKTGRPDMNEQRNVDAKTFGSIAQTYKSSHLRPSGTGRNDKARNRRFNKSTQPGRNRRRNNNRRQRPPPVQRQWMPRTN